MRYLLVLLPLVAVGCADTDSAYYGYSPTSAYASGYGYGGSYYTSPAYDEDNCGTPDEPKACPPMPRHPLPYYPANR